MDALLEFALELARDAGTIALEHFGSASLGVERKADGSPVTVADRAIERRLRERIAAAFPDDGILGEEEDERHSSSGRRWILDPIDGTVSFAQGVPLFATLIAVEDGGSVTHGVCHLPGLSETVAANAGGGAWWWRSGAAEPEPARVSAVEAIEDALGVTTGEEYWRGTAHLDDWRRIADRLRHVRGWSDAYAFALLATGRADLVVEITLNPWDVAPFLPIVEEAGGRLTDLSGERTVFGGNALATNGRVHDATLDLFRNA